MSDVSLKEHIEKQIAWIDRYFEKRLEAMHVAVGKAEEQLGKRLEGMNEFRDTLRDQASRLATKDEFYIRGNETDRRIKELEISKARLEGRSAIISVVVSVFISGLVIVISRFLQ